MITSTCPQCGDQFTHVNRKRRPRKYCSTRCNGDAQRGTPNATCSYCGVRFFRHQHAARPAANYYCCRKHKDLDFRGENHPLWNNSGAGYRKHLKDACERCGWNRYREVLVVHHRDHDRTNNEPKNLETLCPTCHDTHHFETRTARFTGMS